MDDRNFKNLPSTKFDLQKTLKIHEFFSVLQNIHKKCSQSK